MPSIGGCRIPAQWWTGHKCELLAFDCALGARALVQRELKSKLPARATSTFRCVGSSATVQWIRFVFSSIGTWLSKGVYDVKKYLGLEDFIISFCELVGYTFRLLLAFIRAALKRDAICESIVAFSPSGNKCENQITPVDVIPRLRATPSNQFHSNVSCQVNETLLFTNRLSVAPLFFFFSWFLLPQPKERYLWLREEVTMRHFNRRELDLTAPVILGCRC